MDKKRVGTFGIMNFVAKKKVLDVLFRLGGYKDVVVQVSFLQVLHDCIFVDLGEQHHVIHAALFDILTLPVVLASLQEETRGKESSFLIGWGRGNRYV